MPKADVRAFVGMTGNSLSAVDGAVNLSPLTWLWSGSNMAPSDYARILRAFHVDNPWASIHALSLRLGLVGGDPLSDLTSFGQERHRAAHDSTHQVFNLWIPVAIDHLEKFAISVDAFVSIAADALRRGDSAFLTDSNWSSSRVGLRWVQQRPSHWAEFNEDGARAFRVGADQHTVAVAAAARSSNTDVLVIVDGGGQLIDWSIPIVG